MSDEPTLATRRTSVAWLSALYSLNRRLSALVMLPRASCWLLIVTSPGMNRLWVWCALSVEELLPLPGLPAVPQPARPA